MLSQWTNMLIPEKNTRFMLKKEAEFPLKLMTNCLFGMKVFAYILGASLIGPNFYSIQLHSKHIDSYLDSK